jgi:hypothetical protein
VGDGSCDDGSFTDFFGDELSVYFDCVELDWDLGDCEEGEDADGSAPEPGDTCDLTSSGDGVLDCSGDCVSAETAEAWTGDGFCDDEEETFDYHLFCAAFDFDEGDCS